MKQNSVHKDIVKKITKYSMALLFVCGAMLFGGRIQGNPEQLVQAANTVTPIPTPIVKLQDITAYYSGVDTLMVGKDIDLSEITVTAYYDDGTSAEVTGFTLSNKTVKAVGENKFIVMYKGKSDSISVWGKKVTSVSAYYIGDSISIGNSADPRQIVAEATFSDGSSEEVTDYTLYNDVVKKTGNNVVTLIYGTSKTTFTVYGIAQQAIIELSASYEGSGVAVGSSVPERELTVVAVYKDGSSEVINNYTLSPEVISVQGPQNVIAAYRGKTATFTVTGIEKTIVSIDATYNGEAVAVGYSVRSSDIDVIATYSDGNTEKITNFNIMSPSIMYVGYHIITVEASGCTDEFIVQGVAEEKISYDNASTFSITNGSQTGTVSLALYSNLDKTKFGGRSVTPSTVRNLMKRSTEYTYYIAFDVELYDVDMDQEFPITMKITLPPQFKISGCKLFYTPNCTSILGEMSYEKVGTSAITAKIHNPGTYILTYLKP